MKKNSNNGFGIDVLDMHNCGDSYAAVDEVASSSFLDVMFNVIRQLWFWF